MTTDHQEIVKQLLDDEPELILKNGENELLIETTKYSLIITYYLDCEYESFSDVPSKNSYTFNIFDIYLTDNITSEEYFIKLNNDIEYTILDNAHIDDWSIDNSTQRYYPQCY